MIGRIKNIFRRPANAGSGVVAPPRPAGGTEGGSLSNWHPTREHLSTLGQTRDLIARRANDLAVSDARAASILDGLAVNIVGTGLTPQARPRRDLLGWTEEQAREFTRSAERVFADWSRSVDQSGQLSFNELQYQSAYSLLVNGEFFRAPRMRAGGEKTISLYLQRIDPSRVRTPDDLADDARVFDGVRLDASGRPIAYYVAQPENGAHPVAFAKIPARLGHRPGIIHGFFARRDEQVRGISVLAPAIKLMRDLNDYMDYEVIGAIVAAQHVGYWEHPQPEAAFAGWSEMDAPPDTDHDYREIVPGTMTSGPPGAKPHIFSHNRPGTTFPTFTERLSRDCCAAAGLPYEVVARDYSKTNYAGARAALLDAGRVVAVYQQSLSARLCRPTWEMVLEEAFLRGLLAIPPGSPDWYSVGDAYTRAAWLPPRRGHVDPVKEISAAIAAMNANISTLADVCGEQGLDWEDQLEQAGRERAAKIERGLGDNGANQ